MNIEALSSIPRRLEYKLFDKGYTGEATKYVPTYSVWGPNRNTYAEKLITACGGSANFPPGAVGAD